MPPSNRTPSSGNPVSEDSALALVLQRMDQIHTDLKDIKETQTDMITRLAVGAQTIESVKGLPTEVAVLKGEIGHIRDDANKLITRIADLEADRKTLMWKAISICGFLATVIGVAAAYISKVHP